MEEVAAMCAHWSSIWSWYATFDEVVSDMCVHLYATRWDCAITTCIHRRLQQNSATAYYYRNCDKRKADVISVDAPPKNENEEGVQLYVPEVKPLLDLRECECLSEGHKELLLLYHVDRYRLRELGKMYGISQTMIHIHVKAATGVLRKWYNGEPIRGQITAAPVKKNRAKRKKVLVS